MNELSFPICIPIEHLWIPLDSPEQATDVLRLLYRALRLTPSIPPSENNDQV